MALKASLILPVVTLLRRQPFVRCSTILSFSETQFFVVDRSWLLKYSPLLVLSKPYRFFSEVSIESNKNSTDGLHHTKNETTNCRVDRSTIKPPPTSTEEKSLADSPDLLQSINYREETATNDRQQRPPINECGGMVGIIMDAVGSQKLNTSDGEAIVESSVEQNSTKTENEAISDCYRVDGTSDPVIFQPFIEHGEKVVNVSIPGTDSLVVLVNDDIVQMVKQNSKLMKQRTIRDARDQKGIDPPSLKDELWDVPLVLYNGEPTYFQFDYRNHETCITDSMQGLLRKIEATLDNADLEPFGKDRGVETMQQNVEKSEGGKCFRINNHTFEKPGVFQRIKVQKPKLNRFILIKLLKERHCIYAVGTHQRLGDLNRKAVGKSFFGPESDVLIRPREAEEILTDLWFRGVSERFQSLQRRHFAILRRSKAKIKKEKQILAILEAAGIDVSNRKTKKVIWKKMMAALRDPAKVSKEVIAILEAAKKMKVEFEKGKLKSVTSDGDKSDIDEILLDGENEFGVS